MIIIGSDHGGFTLKRKIIEFFEENVINYCDCGCYDDKAVDYPDIAKDVCGKMLREPNSFAVLICGTGIGMAMAANKIRGVRAAVCHDTYSAKMARMHNNANTICFGARVLGDKLCLDILKEFIKAEFEGGRHEKRIGKIE